MRLEPLQFCPICHVPVSFSPRYPHYVCEACFFKAQAPNERVLRFTNESFSGGYIAYYADTGERYLSHDCFISGVRCRADEAHMGGIVIQPVD